jgi:hypothetical protein
LPSTILTVSKLDSRTEPKPTGVRRPSIKNKPDTDVLDSMMADLMKDVSGDFDVTPVPVPTTKKVAPKPLKLLICTICQTAINGKELIYNNERKVCLVIIASFALSPGLTVSLFSLVIQSACLVRFVEQSLETAFLILNSKTRSIVSATTMLFAEESSAQHGRQSERFSRVKLQCFNLFV